MDRELDEHTIRLVGLYPVGLSLCFANVHVQFCQWGADTNDKESAAGLWVPNICQSGLTGSAIWGRWLMVQEIRGIMWSLDFYYPGHLLAQMMTLLSVSQ